MNGRRKANDIVKFRAPLATALVLISIGSILAPVGLSQPTATPSSSEQAAPSPTSTAASSAASSAVETPSITVQNKDVDSKNGVTNDLTAVQKGDPREDLKKDRLALAFEHIKGVQPDKAIICLTPLIVHAAASDWKNPETRKLLARYYCLLGRILALDDNCVASAQAQKIASVLDPSNEDPSIYSSYLLLMIGRDVEAQRLLQVSLKKAPSNLLAARQGALCLLKEERVNLAVTLLEDALKLKGAQNDWRIHQLLGRGYLRQGYTKRATERS